MKNGIKKAALLSLAFAIGYGVKGCRESNVVRDQPAVVEAMATEDGRIRVELRQLTGADYNLWSKNVYLTPNPMGPAYTIIYGIKDNEKWNKMIDSDRPMDINGFHPDSEHYKNGK